VVTAALMLMIASASDDDPIGAIAGIVFMVSMFYTFVAHYSLIGELKKKGVDVPIMLWGFQLFFLQFEYLKNRDELGDRKSDFLARSAIVAPFIGLGAVLAAFVIWPGRP
jgi:hypothetical protein